MKTIEKNYEIKQSTDFMKIIGIKNPNFTPANITGWNVYGKLENFYQSNYSVYLSCAIPNPLNGEILIGLSNIQTSQLVAGNYIYDVSAQLPNGQIFMVQSGVMTLTYTVTNLIDPLLPPMGSGGILDDFIDGGIVLNN